MVKLPLVIRSGTHRVRCLFLSRPPPLPATHRPTITAMLHFGELLGDGYDDLASHYRRRIFLLSLEMHRRGDRHTHTDRPEEIDNFMVARWMSQRIARAARCSEMQVAR